MATCSRILAWKVAGTEEPGGLQSTGSQKGWTRLSNWARTKGSFRFFHKVLTEKPEQTFWPSTTEGRREEGKDRRGRRKKGKGRVSVISPWIDIHTNRWLKTVSPHCRGSTHKLRWNRRKEGILTSYPSCLVLSSTLHCTKALWGWDPLSFILSPPHPRTMPDT